MSFSAKSDVGFSSSRWADLMVAMSSLVMSRAEEYEVFGVIRSPFAEGLDMMDVKMPTNGASSAIGVIVGTLSLIPEENSVANFLGKGPPPVKFVS